MANTKSNLQKAKKNKMVGTYIQSVPADDLKRINIDTAKELSDNIIQASFSDSIDLQELDRFTSMSASRDQQFQLIDTMMKDASVNSIVRTFAADATQLGDNGHVIWAESDDPKVSMHVNYLLDRLNLDKLAFGHAYDLVTYGDVYLQMVRKSDEEDPFFKPNSRETVYNARNALNESAVKEAVKLDLKRTNDRYSFYTEEVPDPSTFFELTYKGICKGYIETPNAPSALGEESYDAVSGSIVNSSLMYHMKENDIIIHNADDYVHIMLDSDHTRFPEEVSIFRTDEDYDSNQNGYRYRVRRGKSMLIDAYKTWREKTLLEASILLNRITKSSIVRKVGVEVGNMSKDKANVLLHGVKQMFEQKASIRVGESMSESNQPGPVENFIYYTTHNNVGNITVESVGGDVDVKNLADYDSWVNKFYGHFGIPKQFFGYTDDGAGFNGGSSLSIVSSTYAKLVVMIQNSMIQGYSDMIDLILNDSGLVSYIGRYTLKMKTPVTQEEKDAREALTNKINAASSLSSLFQDVDNKQRRLTILKQIVKPLDYGDEIIQVLDDEIKDLDEKDKKAAQEAEEQAKLDAEASASSGEAPAVDINASDSENSDETNEDASSDADLNATLGDSLANIQVENVEQDEKNILNESNDSEFKFDLDEKDFLAESDGDLPTPEQLDSTVDFTDNSEKENKDQH